MTEEVRRCKGWILASASQGGHASLALDAPCRHGTRMHFELDEEHRMLRDLVQRFVRDELMPLEPAVLARELNGGNADLTHDERIRLNAVSKDMGLWSLDAPANVGGLEMPYVALVAVNEALGSTVSKYTLPPDSPNLRMLAATVNDQQREAYLAPYARGETISAIGISEPSAGADPAAKLWLHPRHTLSATGFKRIHADSVTCCGLFWAKQGQLCRRRGDQGGKPGSPSTHPDARRNSRRRPGQGKPGCIEKRAPEGSPFPTTAT